MRKGHGADDAGCRRRLIRLSAYLERDLAPVARAVVRRHLAACGGCQAVLGTLRKTIALCRESPGQRLSPTASARILRRLRRVARPSGRVSNF